MGSGLKTQAIGAATPIDALLGQVVLSKAGRDAGRAFLVVGIYDAEHLLLADGEMRKLANPKRKKRKHVELTGNENALIAKKRQEGKQVFDAEIRRYLLELGYNHREPVEAEAAEHRS